MIRRGHVLIATVPVMLCSMAARADEFACRSMQSEAKGNLKALYVAEESNRAEFDTYSTDQAKIGFSPKGSTIRYTYVVKSADAKTFLAEARGTLDGAEDVWQIDDANALKNLVDGCAASGSAGVAPAVPTSKLVDGQYELIVEKLRLKAMNGKLAWDPGDLPDPQIFVTTQAEGRQFSAVIKNTLDANGVRFKVHLAAGQKVEMQIWDADALSNDLAASFAFVPFDLPVDADGRVSVTPPDGQIDGDIGLRLKLVKAAPPPEPTTFIVDRAKVIGDVVAFVEKRNAAGRCKKPGDELTGTCGEAIDVAELRGPAVDAQGLYIQTCANRLEPALVVCMPFGSQHKLVTFLATSTGEPKAFYALNPPLFSSAALAGDCASLASHRKEVAMFSTCPKLAPPPAPPPPKAVKPPPPPPPPKAAKPAPKPKRPR